MLVGNYPNSIDAKSRCIIPAKLRGDLGERCMLVKGFDACLYLYPEDGWKDFAAKHIDSRPMEAEDASDLQFFFYSNSQVLEPDTQGRIILPQSFIDYAGIRKEMVNIGFGDHVQIWSREGYEARMDRVQQNPRGLLRGMLKYEQQS